MLPPKMGDGVLGSRVGGVNPTGASLVGASVDSSAMARMGRHGVADLFSPLGTEKQWRDCFQGAATRSAAGLAAESGEANREAWAAMAMEEAARRSKREVSLWGKRMKGAAEKVFVYYPERVYVVGDMDMLDKVI